MTCVYNPLTGRELRVVGLPPAAAPKRVLVVGAGPAGMEAALTAAQRGHRVTVLEQAGRVGGQCGRRGLAAAPSVGAHRRILRAPGAHGAVRAAAGRARRRRRVLALRLTRWSWPPARARSAWPCPAARLRNVHEVVAGLADTARTAVVFDREGLTRAFVAADYLSSRGRGSAVSHGLPEVGPLLDGTCATS